MMADLTKCFFQIGLPEDQRDLFRILWFDNDDKGQGKVVKFRFTRDLWGVKSSPFIASFAIQKTLKDNATGASDLTQDTIRKKIYNDDVIFSVDSLDDAKTIAHEAIELFGSRGFKLVKWSANRDSVPIRPTLKDFCLFFCFIMKLTSLGVYVRPGGSSPLNSNSIICSISISLS